MTRKVTDLEGLIDRICEADDEGKDVSLDSILDAVGRRSFGPMLLVAGLITVAPVIGDIPGVPTIMAAFVLLIALQLLFNRDYFWLPQWLLKRSIKRKRLEKGLSWMRKPARLVDRLIRPRLARFVEGMGVRMIAIVCVLLAAAMPPMELVPFSANGAGAALVAFGLALIARDGLLAVLALLITFTTLGLVAYGLIGS